ncbi:ABC transporter permease [Spiroplasma chinense]|uniref:ABC transporter permease n=1 Tax=Spiroplasma chinense TaxID=216932 RepID=A0A5B9Y319_9MOLU|nr:ABC transporter permease [Spiroplasma chinense]QEH61450.1 ABC transporter permease [Spiroplasma chinense]
MKSLDNNNELNKDKKIKVEKIKKEKVSKDKPEKFKYKRLILKSGFKNAVRNIFQLFGLAILVATTFMISMSVVITNGRVNNNYKNILTTSVQHDFIVDVSNSPRVSFQEDQWIGGENIDEFSNQDLFEQYLMNVLSRKGINKDNSGQVTGNDYFDWSRTETRNFYGLQNNQTDLNVKVITKTSLVDESKDVSKTGQPPVDKLVLENNQTENIFSEDKDISRRQVVMQSNFASKNNIKIGDIVRLTPDNYGSELLVKKDVTDIEFGGEVSITDETVGIDSTIYKDQNWFQVIGYGTSADFIYPTIGTQSIIPSSKTDMTAYVDPAVFGLTEQRVNPKEGSQIILYSYDLASSKLSVQSENDREIYFSGKFINDPEDVEGYLEAFNNEWIRYGHVSSSKVKLFYKLNDPGYKWSIRTSAYSKVILSYWLMSAFIIVLITIICIFSVTLIVKKQFDDAKSKLGTFKAMGYSNRELLVYFVATPFLIAGVGALMGYIIMMAAQNALVAVFLNYFSLQSTTVHSFWWQAILIILAIIGVLVATTLTIGYSVIEQNALYLLSGNASRKSSRLGMWVKVLFRKARPSIKLHAALTIGSMPKIIGTSFTLLISTFLISISLITPDILRKNSSATFAGLNYSGTVEYNEPVLNNPATFFKTYNPNKDNDWKYKSTNLVTEINDATNNPTQYETAYPIVSNGDGTYKYDTKKIIKDLMNGDISQNYWSYNIPTNVDKDPTAYYEYAKVNYSNWKNLSLQYLEALDSINTDIDYSDGQIPFTAITSLTKQWTDYKYLIDDIESTAISLSSSANGGNLYENSLRKIALSLQNFYKKYHSGIPVKINSSYLSGSKLNSEAVSAIDFDKQLIDSSTNQIYDTYKVRTPLKLATKANPLFYGLSGSNESTSSDETWRATVSSFAKDLNVKENSLQFKKEKMESVDVNDKSLKTDDLIKFNTYLITWYWINFEGKIGTMLLEANYQNSNNVVQKSIIQKIENGENYNITTGVVPYDLEKEELGTLINGIYKTSQNSQKIKIYGIDEDTRAVDLKDTAGNNLTPNLFATLADDYKDYTPIVVNQTVAKKLNVGFKDVIDIDVIKKALLDNDNKTLKLDDVQMGVKSAYKYDGESTTNDIISEAKKNYYAYNSNNKGWNSTSTFDTAKINGYKVASSSVGDLGTNTEILNAVNSSKVKVENLSESKKFIVVGVSDNYGESKAWISNENANDVLGYKEVKKYFFNKFFINEWKSSPGLKNFYDVTIMEDVTKAQWENFINLWELKIANWEDGDYSDSPPGVNNPYDDFVQSYLNISDEATAAKRSVRNSANYLFKMFNNLYPTFNYKFLLDDEYDDQQSVSPKTQAYGDYSANGMVGSSSISTDSTGLSTIEYTQGHEQSGIANNYLMSDRHKLLKNIEDLTTLLIYVIMFVALIISIIIIVITTSLIIEENSQFIATMKILGYSNAYVMMQVSGIYLMPILIMFGVGFVLGNLMLSKVTTYISKNYAFVIPFNFGIYVPFAVLGILLLIYVSTITITYKRFSRIKPTDSLQISS